MSLTPEETKVIQTECLLALKQFGVVPDGNFIFINSGTLGLKHLGKVDFLAKTGYRIIWRT